MSIREAIEIIKKNQATAKICTENIKKQTEVLKPRVWQIIRDFCKAKNEYTHCWIFREDEKDLPPDFKFIKFPYLDDHHLNITYITIDGGKCLVNDYWEYDDYHDGPSRGVSQREFPESWLYSDDFISEVHAYGMACRQAQEFSRGKRRLAEQQVKEEAEKKEFLRLKGKYGG